MRCSTRSSGARRIPRRFVRSFVRRRPAGPLSIDTQRGSRLRTVCGIGTEPRLPRRSIRPVRVAAAGVHRGASSQAGALGRYQHCAWRLGHVRAAVAASIRDPMALALAAGAPLHQCHSIRPIAHDCCLPVCVARRMPMSSPVSWRATRSGTRSRCTTAIATIVTWSSSRPAR